MKAMIFAAGKGTRLGPITGSLPKALVDINGKTALRIAVEHCFMHGFSDFIVNIHHFPEMVEAEVDRLRQEGYSISISDEREQLLETGGGLYKARKFFDNEPFLLYNVDIITDLDLTALYRFHQEKAGIAALSARHRKGNRFLLIDHDCMLRGWKNNSTGELILISGRESELREIGFSGIHIADPHIFNFMTEGVYSMTTLYLRLAKKHKIYTCIDDKGYWSDIGTPENLEYARQISNLPERPGKNR
jgi:NDP-sugar pyrophosphorylase family protein